MGKVAETLGGGLISGPASIISGVMQSRSQNKATEAQSKATAAALAYEKEKDALRRSQYEQAWNTWNASRNALLQRYGISLPNQPTSAFGTPPPGQGNAVPRPVQAGPTAAPAGQPVNINPGDMGSWNEWNRYGLER